MDRQSYQSGKHPTQAVAEHFGIGMSNAAKWVHRARHEFYLLGPTKKGMAGGTADSQTGVPRRNGDKKGEE